MFSLTPSERKVLLFIGIVILCGAGFKFFQTNVSSNAETTPVKIQSIKVSLINVNTASQEELEKLPGIGPHIARNIIAYRSQVQRFKSLEDLDKVKGIGEKRLQLIRDYITF